MSSFEKAFKSAKAKMVVVALLIVTLALPALSGCSTSEDTELIHLKVVELPYIPFTTFYIAQEEGFFTEQGLDVELVRFTSATQAVPLLAQGDLDVVSGSINAGVINAIAQDMTIKIVAGRDYVDPDIVSLCLMVRKDLYDSGELDTVAELEGRQIAMACTACLYDFGLTQILKSADLTLDDVTIARMGSADILAGFSTDAVDAATLGSMHARPAESLGYAEILEPFSEFIPNCQTCFMMFGPSILENNPEAGKKFMVAYLKGVEQYMQGKTDRNVEIAEKYTGIDREKILDVPWPPMYEDGRVNEEDLAAFQDWAYEQGLVDEKLDIEEIVNTSFIDYANDILD
jgi:NitT/TauT family transport system substrate-binding protein